MNARRVVRQRLYTQRKIAAKNVAAVKIQVCARARVQQAEQTSWSCTSP